jgi:hypothetical protein
MLRGIENVNKSVHNNCKDAYELGFVWEIWKGQQEGCVIKIIQKQKFWVQTDIPLFWSNE